MPVPLRLPFLAPGPNRILSQLRSSMVRVRVKHIVYVWIMRCVRASASSSSSVLPSSSSPVRTKMKNKERKAENIKKKLFTRLTQLQACKHVTYVAACPMLPCSAARTPFICNILSFSVSRIRLCALLCALCLTLTPLVCVRHLLNYTSFVWVLIETTAAWTILRGSVPPLHRSFAWAVVVASGLNARATDCFARLRPLSFTTHRCYCIRNDS